MGRHTDLAIPYGPVTNARKTHVRKHTALGCNVPPRTVLHSGVNERGGPRPFFHLASAADGVPGGRPARRTDEGSKELLRPGGWFRNQAALLRANGLPNRCGNILVFSIKHRLK